jgi:hypothetical protein
LELLLNPIRSCATFVRSPLIWESSGALHFGIDPNREYSRHVRNQRRFGATADGKEKITLEDYRVWHPGGELGREGEPKRRLSSLMCFR